MENLEKELLKKGLSKDEAKEVVNTTSDCQKKAIDEFIKKNKKIKVWHIWALLSGVTKEILPKEINW